MAKWATLSDDFPGSALSALWTSSASATVAANRVGIAVGGNATSALHDLSSSSVFLKLQSRTLAAGAFDSIALVETGGGTVAEFFTYSDGNLWAEWYSGGYEAVTVAYNATSMAFLRYRHDGTNFHFEYGPDGTSWTSLKTKAVTGATVSSLRVNLYSSGGTGTAYFSKLNISGAPATPRRTKVWNGTSWTSGVLKVWNGSAWTPGALKVWNGSSWS